MATQKNKYIRLSIDLTMGEYRNLHKRVIEIGCPKSEFVRRAIREYLKSGNTNDMAPRLYSSTRVSVT